MPCAVLAQARQWLRGLAVLTLAATVQPVCRYLIRCSPRVSFQHGPSSIRYGTTQLPHEGSSTVKSRLSDAAWCGLCCMHDATMLVALFEKLADSFKATWGTCLAWHRGSLFLHCPVRRLHISQLQALSDDGLLFGTAQTCVKTRTAQLKEGLASASPGQASFDNPAEVEREEADAADDQHKDRHERERWTVLKEL
eukprot:6475319-Amphidinium_carterae.2